MSLLATEKGTEHQVHLLPLTCPISLGSWRGHTVLVTQTSVALAIGVKDTTSVPYTLMASSPLILGHLPMATNTQW